MNYTQQQNTATKQIRKRKQNKKKNSQSIAENKIRINKTWKQKPTEIKTINRSRKQKPENSQTTFV